MKVIETPISGLYVFEPKVFEDSRGYFFESFSKKVLKEAGYDVDFVQDNESMSHKGVMRGLHLQRPPFTQGKLVRVVSGSVLDVVVDLRVGSPTFGKHYKQLLDTIEKKVMYVPHGFAHGFATLEDYTVFQYKCTNYYNKESEDAVNLLDEALEIEWPFDNPILSEKDLKAKPLADFISPFEYAK